MSPPGRETPRIIFLALDDFGEQVLTTLRETCRGVVPDFKRRLTAGLVHEADDNFWLWSMDKVRPDEADPAPLVKQLVRARNERVCSQLLRVTLEKEGYRVHHRLEVYALSEVKSLDQLQFMQEVLHRVQACLQDYEVPLITSIVNMAEYDQPGQDRADRVAVLEDLNRWLAKKDANLPGLERCYVVTQEMVSGQAAISPDELVNRTAGFLVALYLDGSRQPDTEHQYLLLGSPKESKVELGGDQGLCETFGQASLTFDFERVLDWCAYHETRSLLQEELLASDQPASDEIPESQLWFEAELQYAGETLSLNDLTKQIIEGVLEDDWPYDQAPESNPTTVSLVDEYQRYRRADEILDRTGNAFKDKVNERLGKLEQVLNNLLDNRLMGDPQGLAQAEELLDVIRAGCWIELNEARRLGSPPLGQADFVQTINEKWYDLERAVIASPTPEVFWGRSILLGVLVGLGVLLGGGLGLGLAGAALMGLLAWNWYARYWLKRLQRAQKQYRKELKTWLRVGLDGLIRPLVEEMMTILATRYEESTGEEWQAIQHWRTTLINAVEQCRAQESSKPNVPTTSEQANSAWVITPHIRQAYYKQLATRPLEQTAEIFLDQLRRPKMDRWREYTGEQMVEKLVQICREYYWLKMGPKAHDLEYHLGVIGSLDPVQLVLLFESLVQNSQPLARYQWLHGHWKRPHLRLLIVQDPKYSVFSDLAKQHEIQLIGGAPSQQIICIQTIHHLPINDLGIANNWSQSLADQGGRRD